MNGYQITFFTERDQRHGGKQLAEWIYLALEMKLPIASMLPTIVGYERNRHLHSIHFLT
jgi:PII-like signaling protein